MGYFPFFIEMEDKKCLIVGAGKVALRKCKTLLEFGAQITVVGIEACQELRRLAKEGTIQLLEGKCSKKELEDAFFVIVATDDVTENERISNFCKERGILVNVATGKQAGTVVFPSVVKAKDVVVGISSGGDSPVVTKQLRKRVEEVVPEYLGEVAEQLGRIRPFVLENVSREKHRLCFEAIYQRAEEKKGRLTQEELEQIVEGYK